MSDPVLIPMMSYEQALRIAREYFSDIPATEEGDDFLGFVLWNATGWPCFFKDGEKSLREQLLEASKMKVLGDAYESA